MIKMIIKNLFLMESNFTVLDDKKLQQLDTEEKKELLIFQWLSNLEKQLLKTKPDLEIQDILITNLYKYLTLLSPKPKRQTRNIISRCLVIIYEKGDNRTLFDTLSKLQNLLANKNLQDILVKA